jgi:hypothetical protein
MPEEWRGWGHVGYIDDLKFMYHWPGVYAVRLINAQGETPIPIGRFLRTDKSGTILIGVSKDLGDRLSKFFHSYLEDARTHSEGRRLHLVRMVCEYEEKVYPDSSMQFHVKRIPNIEEAKDEEERLLKSYFKRFGELPPLNAALGKKRIPWSDTYSEENTNE